MDDRPPSLVRTVDEIADAYVERSAALDPVGATVNGVAGHDSELTDYSPDAAQERAALARTFAAELEAWEQAAALPRDTRAARAMRERLETEADLHDAGEHLRDLSTLFGPLQQVRSVFDLMPTGTEEDWAVVAHRLEQVPWSLSTARHSLTAGLEAGLPGPRRLALVVADQARTWAGTAGSAGFFSSLVQRAEDVPPSLRARLEAAATAAGRACAEHARYLDEQYAPRASTVTGVGQDRYRLHARAWTGDDLDLADTYDWGWAELARLLARMEEVAGRILPGASIDAAVEHVTADPDYVVHGEDALRGWLQDLMDATIDQLDGRHFDIPAEIRRVEAMIAPPGGAAAMYYTPPSEDFTRPGRTWYPTQGRTTFPLWLEKAICYHEGVPGHHLEVGGAKARPGTATRFQRLTYIAGYSEGWALYAERLMGELGYLDDPVYEIGALASSAMRAARVVVDLGMHLGLRVPDDPGFRADWVEPGAAMTPETALEIAVHAAPFPRAFMASEIDRYLGLPAQAISYKVGERVWLDARERARHRRGGSFDLKEFHSHALGLGAMGLAQLRDEMAGW
jgi:uncharacterized protein (DUF885 family)